MGKWTEKANKTYKDLQKRKELREIGQREAGSFASESYKRVDKRLSSERRRRNYKW